MQLLVPALLALLVSQLGLCWLSTRPASAVNASMRWSKRQRMMPNKQGTLGALFPFWNNRAHNAFTTEL